jgi:hypothetical protein
LWRQPYELGKAGNEFQSTRGPSESVKNKANLGTPKYENFATVQLIQILPSEVFKYAIIIPNA